MALRTVGVRLTADVSSYMSSLARAGAATKDFTGKLDNAAKGGKLDKVADTAGVAGIALAGMAGYAIKANADFQKAMSGVSAATHASASDIGKLRQAALQAGKDTQYSATQAADGITELSKAGVLTADILGGGLKGALSLAAAGQLSVADASETAATTMTQFGLAGKDIPHVADVLAAAAGKAQGSVADMSVALKYAGLPAHALGISLEETAGTLALFAKSGLIGEQAGTGFRGVLASLEGPSKQAAATMEDLGLQVYGANGKFVGMTGVAEQLRTKLGGLSEAQRNAALTTIFGRENLQAAIILMQGGQKAVQGWTKDVNEQGYATRTASDLTNNLSGDIERLKGSLETLAIESGSGANSGLRVVTKSLDAMVGQFSRMPSAVGGTLTVLGLVGGAALLGLAGFVKLRKGLAEAVVQLNAMGPAGEKAAIGLQKSASMAGKAALAFAAMEGASAAFNSMDTNAASVDRLTDSLTNLANTGKSSGELNDIFGNNWDKLGRISGFAESADHGFGKFVKTVAGFVPIAGDTGVALGELGSRLVSGSDWDQAKQQMTALDQALTNYMQTANDAKKASELWNQVLSKSGLDSQQLADLLPNAYKEVGALNTAQDQASKSGKAMADGTKAAAGGADALAGAAGPAATETKKLASASDAAAAAAKGQRVALSSLADFMKQETDPVFGLIKAQQELVDAQKAYSKAVKEHGKKSAEAKAADRELAVAAIALQDAVGKTSDDFNGKLSPALKKTLQAAGLSKAEIHGLELQFIDAKKAADKYDGKYVAKASAPGAVTAKQQMADAWAEAKGFEGAYTAKLLVSGDKIVNQKLAALLVQQRALASPGMSLKAAGAAVQKDLDRNRQRGYDSGGWTGPGDAYDVAGLVHADEHVIRKPSRRKLEAAKPGALDYMNETGKWPGYALGGHVVDPFTADVSKTYIPKLAFSAPGGSGGPGYKWMEAVVRAAFPGMAIYSDYRPGAVTLTGNRSYHAVGRAVDFAPSLPLAEWINLHYMKATKELITPWQSLNIHNGARHHYSALIENQHNFAGGNAHDHWAMKSGGVISEPIFGVGASGRTYSFGEGYQPERVTPMWQNSGGGSGATINVNFNGPVGSQLQLETWMSGTIDNLRRKGKI